MHPNFSELTPQWFKRAFNYTGSIQDFRYRFIQVKDPRSIEVSVYTKFCYEVASDIQTETFPWDDDGIEALKQWIQGKYEEYLEKNS